MTIYLARLQLVVRLGGQLVHATHHGPQPKPEVFGRNAFLGTELLQRETPDLGRRVEPERPLQKPNFWGNHLTVSEMTTVARKWVDQRWAETCALERIKKKKEKGYCASWRPWHHAEPCETFMNDHVKQMVHERS